MADDTMRRRRELAARAVIMRRKELGLTQEGLAQRAGVVVRTIHNIENGRWPNARTRALIEDALEWPAGEFERITAPPRPRIDPKLIDEALRLSEAEFEALVGDLRRRRGEIVRPELRVVNGDHHDGT